MFVVCLASVLLEIDAFVDDEKGVAVVLLVGRAVVSSVVLVVVVSEGLRVVVRFWSTHLSSFEEKTVPLLQQQVLHLIVCLQDAFLLQQYVHQSRRDPSFLKHFDGFLRAFVTGIFEKHCQRTLDHLQELEVETDGNFKPEHQKNHSCLSVQNRNTESMKIHFVNFEIFPIVSNEIHAALCQVFSGELLTISISNTPGGLIKEPMHLKH